MVAQKRVQFQLVVRSSRLGEIVLHLAGGEGQGTGGEKHVGGGGEG